jgi:hypothetical protein
MNLRSSPEPDRPDRREWTGPAESTDLTPACLDEETIAALAEGTLDEATRTAVLPHVVSCARCRAAIAATARGLADPGVARELAGAGASPRTGRWLAWTGSIAAAVALIILVTPYPGTAPEMESHRAPVAAGSDIPAQLSPAGTVAEVERLQWSTVAGAGRYRVTLFEPGGRVLFETTPTDSFAVLPDSVSLSPGIQYLWKVEARIGPDRWVSSELATFRLSAGARP